MFLEPVFPVLDRAATIVLASRRSGGAGVSEAAGLEKLETRDALQHAVHGCKSIKDEHQHRDHFGGPAHGP